MMDLPEQVQSFVRSAYGTLMCLWLIALWRNRSRVLVSETWGGYVEASPSGDRVHNPAVSCALLAVWTLTSLSLAAGILPLAAAGINLLICRHFFIDQRWKSLSRGFGAPGFIANWLAAAVLLMEITSLPGTSPELRTAAVRMLRVDFACIFLSAGFYKLFSGYGSGSGMEYGMANPMWGYWHRFFAKIRPQSVIFKVLNFSAWFFEVVAAFLMFFPVTMGWGGLLLATTFVFILTQIRLGFLCHMVILIGCFYATAGDPFSKMLGPIGSLELIPDPAIALPSVLQQILTAVFTLHTILIPVCFAGIWYNHLGRRRWPAPIQRALDGYANLFGIIIWRVFSSDLTRFEVTVSAGPDPTRRVRWSDPGKGWEITGRRFEQVFESITLVCLFTTLNYFPDRKDLFHKKLVKYARSLGRSARSVRFDIHVLEKSADRFEGRFAAAYEVDTDSGAVTEHEAIPGWIRPDNSSLVHSTQKPGSYAS